MHNERPGQPEKQLVHVQSFEEAITLLGGVAIGAIAYGVAGSFFVLPVLASVLIGILAAIGIAHLTSSELILTEGFITHRNRFRVRSFPLSHVDKVAVQPFWRGVPGQAFMVLLRSPPAKFNGYFGRVGVFAWPSARGWADAVNFAVRNKSCRKERIE
ncbi:MAG TPA: hypothetical protein VH684_10785 [Xanthobacteraceae bacterium]